MTDYKRMVSYMYQYENGVKKKNVGYVRIEVKSGLCKFTLHMQLLGQLDSIFPTYLIRREDNSIELIYLGDTILRNQMMDSRLTANENSVMDSGHNLSDMTGLLLFLHDNVFFATEWDDKPIIASEVLQALKPKKKEQKKEEPSEETPETDVSAASVHYAMQASEQTSEQAQPKEFTVVLSPEGLSLSEEIKMPKYMLPRGWKTIECFGRPSAADALQEDEKSLIAAETQQKDGKNVIATDLDTTAVNIMDNYENVDNISKENKKVDDSSSLKDDVGMESLSANATTTQGEAIEEQKIDLPDHEVAKHLFDTYPRIYPFEDNEIILCVKIEPKDIGLLPKELWAFSNNSFLMHGFYCYHHLIFAKLKDRYGCRYILGIPGIYHNRERFMARMFGFESFKSIRKRELQQGDFGYWYLNVNF